MNKYEFMLIIDPNLSEEEKNVTLATIKNEITQAGGKIEKEDIWGERKLAYKINKSNL
jgi:small subunit ribosomal protein S6